MYENGLQLLISADVPIEGIFIKEPSVQPTDREDENFAVTRAVSRLKEMQTLEYLQASSRRRRLSRV